VMLEWAQPAPMRLARHQRLQRRPRCLLHRSPRRDQSTPTRERRDGPI
jgi:hypothetical protein